MVTLGCNLEEKEGMSSYVAPDGIEMGSARILDFHGMVSCESIFNLMKEIK